MLTPQLTGTAKSDSYVYDPLDIRPGLEQEQEPSPNYLTDQTSVLTTYGNGVIYHSQPFTEPTEVTGYLKLKVWIEMDVPDTDLAATLFEILPDNRSILLTQDFIRARYRESLRQEKLVTPGEIYCYDFDSFTYFSRLIGKGSRLRLVISSPNSIQLEKNYNSGGVVAEETGKDARLAHIKVYHDAEHPSILELPVVK